MVVFLLIDLYYCDLPNYQLHKMKHSLPLLNFVVVWSVCFIFLSVTYQTANRFGFWKKRSCQLLVALPLNRTSSRFWWSHPGKHFKHQSALEESSACFHHTTLSRILMNWVWSIFRYDPLRNRKCVWFLSWSPQLLTWFLTISLLLYALPVCRYAPPIQEMQLGIQCFLGLLSHVEQI